MTVQHHLCVQNWVQQPGVCGSVFSSLWPWEGAYGLPNSTSGDRSDQTEAQYGPTPMAIAIKTPEDVASATDPSILLSAGKHWLDNGNTKLANHVLRVL